MRPVRLYLSGPVSLGGSVANIEANLQRFHEADDQLTDAGFEVFSPARILTPRDRKIDFFLYQVSCCLEPSPPVSWPDWMRRALGQLVCCDGIALLDGHEKSRGCAVEVMIGSALGMKALPVTDWLVSHPSLVFA